jgi:hypothetical protein
MAASLKMQRGACWLTLGRLVKAIGALETVREFVRIEG